MGVHSLIKRDEARRCPARRCEGLQTLWQTEIRHNTDSLCGIPMASATCWESEEQAFQLPCFGEWSCNANREDLSVCCACRARCCLKCMWHQLVAPRSVRIAAGASRLVTRTLTHRLLTTSDINASVCLYDANVWDATHWSVEWKYIAVQHLFMVEPRTSA